MSIIPFPTGGEAGAPSALTLLEDTVIDTGVVASGPEGLALVLGGSAILSVVGGVLTELLGGGAATQQKVVDASNTAVSANQAVFGDSVPKYADFINSLWEPNALLASQAAGGALAAAEAMQRLQTGLGPNGGLASTSEVVGWFTQLEDAINSARNAQNAAIDQEISDLRTDTITWVNQLNVATQQARALLQQQDQAYTDQQVGIVLQRLITDATNIIAWVEQVETTLTGDLQNAAQQLTASMRQIEQWASTSLAAIDAQVASAANQAESNAVSALNAQTAESLAPIWSTTANAVNGTAQQVLTDNPGLSGSIQAMTTTAPDTIAGALVGLSTAVNTLNEATDDCALPNCSAKNKLGSDFQSLLNLLADGAFVAFIVAAVDDPEGTATLAEDLMVPIAEGIVSAFRDLVGIVS